jgi:hypothetical protein
MGLRIKPGYSLHRLENGAVWIGPQIPGEATEITDDAGVVWPICRRLDGTRTREVLVEEVLAEQPPGAEITAGELGEIIDFFIASGWVLDTAAPVPSELSDREIERYQRNAQFFSSIDLRGDHRVRPAGPAQGGQGRGARAWRRRQRGCGQPDRLRRRLAALHRP